MLLVHLGRASVLILSFFQGSICGITFTFTNRCGDTVWPGLLSGSGTPPLETTGFALAPGQLRSLYVPQGWSGRFWGRSGCTFDASGKGSCATGDCGSGEVECHGAGASPPTTLAEFTLDDDGGKDFYDALYHEYYGDKQGALENLIQCGNWKKAHTIFVTSVAHSMFLSYFYVLKNSMQERNAMDDSGSLEEMSESCRSFFGRLNESLLVWGSKLPVESRACYSKMAEELCALLVDTPSETLNLPMGCLLTMLNAPLPDESRSSYLQDALSVFTKILCSDP
ncbi:Nuclear pore complex protein NUP96 [Zea mays]|uniref:Nuclear pore complex protein NUP96 n=1 Tax=Zea mays TaxID=4577 RepID=A0A3L6FB58_MAIZE|nr:hypothetical protein Zm00014a_039537 [Zea mays]PWZ30133.1 Nuclear pore complex protein NUP96 [Zea mays]